MKTRICLLFIVLAAAGTLMAWTMKESNQVKHVVVFKFKSKATAAEIAQVTQAFKDLKGKIPGIVSFEYGENNSPEKLNKGFTHVYLLTFENAAARDAYLPHEAHKNFGALLGKLDVLEEPFVVDFQVKE
jgi:hypothetical protein